jgi:hypothetical protein
MEGEGYAYLLIYIYTHIFYFIFILFFLGNLCFKLFPQMHRLAKNPQGITGAQIEPTEVYNHLFPWLQGLVIFSIFRNY